MGILSEDPSISLLSSHVNDGDDEDDDDGEKENLVTEDLMKEKEEKVNSLVTFSSQCKFSYPVSRLNFLLSNVLWKVGFNEEKL